MRTEICLCLHIDDQTRRLRRRNHGRKEDVKDHCSFIMTGIYRIHAVDQCGVLFIRENRCSGNTWRGLNASDDVLYRHFLTFAHTVFHDPGEDALFAEQLFAYRVIADVISIIFNRTSQRSFHVPSFLSS